MQGLNIRLSRTALARGRHRMAELPSNHRPQSRPHAARSSKYVFNLNHVKFGGLYCTNDPLDVFLAFENGDEKVIAFLAPPEENVVLFPKRNASRATNFPIRRINRHAQR